jgi:hypothetical protein
VGHGVGRVIGAGRLHINLCTRASAATTPTSLTGGAGLAGALIVAFAGLIGSVRRFLLVDRSGGLGAFEGSAVAAALAPAAATPPTASASWGLRAVPATLGVLDVLIDILGGRSRLLALRPRCRRPGSRNVWRLEDHQRRLEYRRRRRRPILG